MYDVFGLIPEPSARDGEDVHQRYEMIRNGQAQGIAGNTYYGYQDDLFNVAIENFRRHGVPVEANAVRLVKGLFQDTLRVEEPVAMAHVDGDWYQSVMTCLRRIEPWLVQDGVLIIDDYDHWSGSRKAVDEYFRDKLGSTSSSAGHVFISFGSEAGHQTERHRLPTIARRQRIRSADAATTLACVFLFGLRNVGVAAYSWVPILNVPRGFRFHAQTCNS